MKVGVHLVNFTLPGGPASIGPTLAAVGRAADEAGVANLSLMDHYLQLSMIGGVDEPMLEGYTTLGFLAAHNATADLQLLVTGVMYRRPGLLAKIVSTLDVLSGGRAVLGMGAAWYEREHLALGVPYPPLAERFERLEETLQIVRQMWSEDDGPFEGRHYRLAETISSPQPLRSPHPPIMIGGGGEKRTLLTTAKYADMWHGFGTPDVVRRKIEILHEHCREVGRDPDAVEPWGGQWICVRDDAEEARQVLDDIKAHHSGWAGPNALTGDPDQIAAKLKEHWDAGTRGFIVGFAYPYDLETMERLAKEVRPRLQRLIGARSDAAAS